MINPDDDGRPVARGDGEQHDQNAPDPLASGTAPADRSGAGEHEDAPSRKKKRVGGEREDGPQVVPAPAAAAHDAPPPAAGMTPATETAAPRPVVEWHRALESEGASGEPILTGFDQYGGAWRYGTIYGRVEYWDGSGWQEAPPNWRPPEIKAARGDDALLAKIKSENAARSKINWYCELGDAANIANARNLLDAWNRTQPENWIELHETPLADVDSRQPPGPSNEPTPAPASGTGPAPAAAPEGAPAAAAAPSVQLTVNNIPYQCRLLNTTGSAHLIYEVTDPRQIHPRVPNSELVVRVPMDPNESNVSMGMNNYQQLQGTVGLPEIYNKPWDDGLYVVERVRGECNPSQWGEPYGPEARAQGRSGETKSFDELPIAQQTQLAAIRALMTRSIKRLLLERKWPLADFRPANVRFRKDDDLVLIDFSIEKKEREEHATRTQDDWLRELRIFLNQFAGESPEQKTKANRKIVDYLLSSLDQDLADQVRNAETKYAYD